MLSLTPPTDYVGHQHAEIVSAFAEQHASGSIYLVLVGRQTDTSGYLLELAHDVATAALVPHEAAKVVEARRKRQRDDELHTLAEHSLNGYSSERIDREIESLQYDWRREREATQQIDTFSFADLRAKYPDLKPPLIDGLARIGETINIIANPKVGKSWFTYYLALCVITGRPVFGRFATTPGA